MLRAMIVTALLLVIPRAGVGQSLSVLHIRIVLAEDSDKATPVPHHALLISDNPATAAPRRIVTGADGTADVRLRPGNYTVESDQPVAFHGMAYQWTQVVDIAAGRDAVLELTARNAEKESATAATPTDAATLEADPAFLLPQWQDSVVAVWTPISRASGFVFDARGLVATNQRAVGAATSVEVQLTTTLKVTARVLAADPVRDVAVLRIDPAVVASVASVPLGCSQAGRPPLADRQEIFGIESPLHEAKDMASGRVTRVEARAVSADLTLAPGGAGGPVFAAGGAMVGITSIDEKDERRRGSRIVRIDEVCEVVASAEKKMSEAAPGGSHLPVEPVKPFPVEALEDAVQHRAGSLNAYQMPSADFDVAFITPIQLYGARHEAGQAGVRRRSGGTLAADTEQVGVRPLMDFNNWDDYVSAIPPVVLVRVTPKLAEAFWTTVARGAARTQGVDVPAIKHFRSGFARLRAFCGDAEVTPIHPFTLEQRLSESEAISEGLYVFAPDALGPQCASVRIELYSQKEPGKKDTRVVDPKIVQQIWRDFGPYRELKN